MKKFISSNWTTLFLLVVISIFSLFTILSVKPENFSLQLIYILRFWHLFYHVQNQSVVLSGVCARILYHFRYLFIYHVYRRVVAKRSNRWIDFGFVAFPAVGNCQAVLIIFLPTGFPSRILI